MNATRVVQTLTIAFALGASACVEEVDVSGLPAQYSLEGYGSWYSMEVAGEAPGHGDTFRRIYVNDLARSYGHAGPYPVGTIMVKEIYDLAGESEQGAFSYSAVMRKVAPADLPSGLELEGGWVFTFIEELTPGNTEFTAPSCYGHCHVQAPIDYAWLDYGL